MNIKMSYIPMIRNGLRIRYYAARSRGTRSPPPIYTAGQIERIRRERILKENDTALLLWHKCSRTGSTAKKGQGAYCRPCCLTIRAISVPTSDVFEVPPRS
jgi:hypothetical protein